jgi:hypothetical protein
MIDFNDPFIIQQSTAILTCFEITTGQCLRARLGISMQAENEVLAKCLFEAPAAILSHDVVSENGKRDNVYNYANKAALTVFERSFEEQTQLASSKSAESNSSRQENRNSLLAQCLAKGSVVFSTQRTSATGKTVELNNAILFNLFDEAGVYAGQAVVFDVS